MRGKPYWLWGLSWCTGTRGNSYCFHNHTWSYDAVRQCFLFLCTGTRGHNTGFVLAQCKRAARLNAVDQTGFAFGADVCLSVLRRRGVRQMPPLQSRAIPMRRSHQFSSRRRQITSPPGSLESELKIYGGQSPPVTFSIML